MGCYASVSTPSQNFFLTVMSTVLGPSPCGHSLHSEQSGNSLHMGTELQKGNNAKTVSSVCKVLHLYAMPPLELFANDFLLKANDTVMQEEPVQGRGYWES